MIEVWLVYYRLLLGRYQRQGLDGHALSTFPAAFLLLFNMFSLSLFLRPLVAQLDPHPLLFASLIVCPSILVVSWLPREARRRSRSRSTASVRAAAVAYPIITVFVFVFALARFGRD